MITAIVLIQADRERIPETAQALTGVPHVAEVYSVTGDWDIVAVLKLPHYDDLAAVVTEGLHRIPGIGKTSTMLAFRAYSPDLLDRGFGIGLEESSEAVE
ncbi:MAG TPA: Lrp/AsnC ligand binding domain-containing protein [Deinococcales bacterium]|nr:Lrp/AsnC ligand binding domain-containing protein [Deinococcales bacterium]